MRRRSGSRLSSPVETMKALFRGRDDAFGTGEGRWVKRPLRDADWVKHLAGDGPGIGIAPLLPDSTVYFAAIDLDEPDFESAWMMTNFIPGQSFVERSRSGNAHVWVFFRERCQAWVVRGVLRKAVEAAGKKGVEIFPKNDNADRVTYGNYINLPYHGDDRPILDGDGPDDGDLPFPEFCRRAQDSLQDPKDWEARADMLNIRAPGENAGGQEWGTAPNLHICAEHILANREENPVGEGHRNAVFFALAKMFSHWSETDHDETLGYLQTINEASPDPLSDAELSRILRNAERGQYTSFGCDDPLVAPYRHPDCKIGE
jgi:hypothetical protein